MDLITKRIYEIADVVGGGTPSTSNEEYWGGDIPWLSPADLTGYQSVYISHGEKFITPEGVKKSSTQRLPAGSVLFSSRAPIGYIAIAQNEIYTNQGFKSLVCKSEVINNLYLYYYLKLNLNYIKNFASGATFPELSANRIKNIKITFCKSLHEQQKIASILSAYDSQIENNQKRIKLLEQMAENLYKEWFVRFRFPGYEKAEFEDGKPIGWKDLQAQDVFNITIGRTPPRKVFEFFSTERENNCSWISISDMKNGMFIKDTSEYLTPEALKACNMPMVKANTVLLSFKLTVGKVAISLEDTSTNEAIAHFNTDDSTLKEYTYLYLKCFNYSKLGNTSAIGNAINSTIVKNMSFILPSKDIILEFHKQAKPLFDEILNLTQQISSLTTQRDLLLPRLMSGKLSI